MVAKVIQGMIGAIVGAVAFVAVRAMISGLDTSDWSSAEIVLLNTVLPLGVAIMAVIVVFVGLTKVQSG